MFHAVPVVKRRVRDYPKGRLEPNAVGIAQVSHANVWLKRWPPYDEHVSDMNGDEDSVPAFAVSRGLPLAPEGGKAKPLGEGHPSRPGLPPPREGAGQVDVREHGVAALDQ